MANLPPEFLVAHRENVEEVDLSRLGNIAVSSERIERGDVLDVTMVTDFRELSTATAPVRVGDDGRVNIPLVGPVAVAGMELQEAERVVAAAGVERGVFRNPSTTLTMRRQRRNRVTVTGAVQQPGVYELPRGNSSLLGALVAAGGLSKEAGPEVEVRNPVPQTHAPETLAPQPPQIAGGRPAGSAAREADAAVSSGTIRVNLISAAREGNGGICVNDGSVVCVARRTLKPVQVLGLVNKPGQYEMPLNQDLCLMDALALAGGTTTSLADKVVVIRQVPGCPEPVKIRASIREAKQSGRDNLRLAPGDVVSVEETPLTFFWDGVRTFVRVGVTGGTTLF